MHTINNQIFTNFLNCKYKAYLKLQGKTGQRSEYESLEASLSEEYQKHAQKHVAASGILASKRTLEVTGNVTLREGNMMVDMDALVKERHSAEPSLTRHVPVIFNYRNKITKKDKLLIAFIGEVIVRKEEAK